MQTQGKKIFVDFLTHLLATKEIESTIELLKGTFKDKNDHFDQLMIASANYNEYKSAFSKEIVSSEDLRLQYNRCIASLSRLITVAEPVSFTQIFDEHSTSYTFQYDSKSSVDEWLLLIELVLQLEQKIPDIKLNVGNGYLSMPNNLIRSFERFFIKNADYLQIHFGITKLAKNNAFSVSEDNNKIAYASQRDVSSSGFWGRVEEAEKISKYIQEKTNINVVCLIGMGGIGKTTLAKRVAEKHSHSFKKKYEIKLLDVPTFDEFLQNIFSELSSLNHQNLSVGLGNLIKILKEHKVLLLLDNFDTLDKFIQPNCPDFVHFKGYIDFIKQFSELGSESFLIITTRHIPEGIKRLATYHYPNAKILQLSPLDFDSCQNIFKGQEIVGTESEFRKVIENYGGNPLQLKLIASLIENKYGKLIRNFLNNRRLFLTKDISEIFESQYNNLSKKQQECLLWLAIEREPITSKKIQEDFNHTGDSILEIEDSCEMLLRSSMVEINSNQEYFLQPVIMEFLEHKIIYIAVSEIFNNKIDILHSFPLLKATSKDYIRESIKRLILVPISEKLESMDKSLEKNVLLPLLREKGRKKGYFAGSIINLLITRKYSFAGEKLNDLFIWQVNFQDTKLVDVDMRNSDLRNTFFIKGFGGVLNVCYLNDDVIALCNVNGNIQIWDYQAEHLIMNFLGHTDWVRTIEFSLDQRWLASGSNDKRVKIWDMHTMVCAYTYWHDNFVRCLKFSPDSSYLASSSNDKCIKIWGLAQSAIVFECKEHSNWIWTLCFSSDSKLLASADDDGNIIIRTCNNWSIIKKLNIRGKSIKTMVFGLNDKCLFIGDSQGLIYKIKLYDYEIEEFVAHSSIIWALDYSINTQSLVSCSDDLMIKAWDAHTMEAKQAFKGHDARIWAVRFSPNGQSIVSCSGDQSIRFWNIQNAELIRAFKGYANQIFALSFSPHMPELLATGSDDKLVRVWNVNTGKVIHSHSKHQSSIRAIAFSEKNNYIASGDENAQIFLWEPDKDRVFNSYIGHNNKIRCLSYNSEGTFLVSGSEDNTIRIWSTETGQCIKVIDEHLKWVRTISISRANPLFASGSEDNWIYIWDIKGLPFEMLYKNKFNSQIWAVSFSPDSKFLIVGGADGVVYSINMQSKEINKLLVIEGFVWTIKFNHSGTYLAIAGSDMFIWLWDFQSNQLIGSLEGHTAPIRSIDFSCDDQLLASSGDDEKIIIWDYKSGKILNVLISERPYENMQIDNINGLADANITLLKNLGAK